MFDNNDAFKAYAVVKPGTGIMLHWVVYHRKEDAEFEAQQWLAPEEYEIKEIMRRMRPMIKK